MNLDFNKPWASDTSPNYPTDAQAKRGLSFLGTEAPTFDLHDAIFQRIDLKNQWLYDQIRMACNRFGQNVDTPTSGGSREELASAMSYAITYQRKADEGGYGIVRMANSAQTLAGQEYNLAVSPKHLAEYFTDQNTWDNTKDKPQTATRWPDYSEVKNTPKIGSAAYKDEKDFESYGSTDALKSSLRDGAYCYVYDNSSAAYTDLPSGSTSLATSQTVKSAIAKVDQKLGSAASHSESDFDADGSADAVKQYADGAFPQRDGIKKVGIYNGAKENPYMLTDDGSIVEIATYNQLVPVTSGDRKKGYIIYPGGYCEQWGEVSYDDIGTSRYIEFTITFPIEFSTIYTATAFIEAEVGQDVYTQRTSLNTKTCSFKAREYTAYVASGIFCWKATGMVSDNPSNNNSSL